jgi:hypothetical protein
MLAKTNENHIFIQKIKNKYYETKYIKKYIPYIIEINKINEYYLLNRDYEYIGIINDKDNNFIKTNPQYYNITGENEESEDEWTRIYIFHDGTSILNNEDLTNIKLYSNKYNEIINNKICLNKCDKTTDLLNVLNILK